MADPYADSKTHVAKFDSTCALCGHATKSGRDICYLRWTKKNGQRVQVWKNAHLACYENAGTPKHLNR
jgi:hypothetical protein